MRRLIIVLISFLLWGQAEARAAAERVVSFDSEIFISRQNVADITETIVYDFGSQRRGIYRYVPTEYTDEQGRRYYLNFDFRSASDGSGGKVQAKIDASEGRAIIRLGDPDKTITGQHTYKLTYRLDPVVSEKDGRGFVNLDITGNGWEVPIERASAVLRFESDVALAEGSCFTGEVGSSQGCLVQESFPPTYVAQMLGAGEGLTINGYLPAGFVDHYLQAGVKPPWSLGAIATFIYWPLFAAAVSMIFWLRWRRERRRKRRQTIVPQYEPPEGMTPAQIGLLQDDSSDIKEVTATIIDLAVRGFLKIEQIKPKRWLFKAKYALHKLKDTEGLSANEATLFNALFRGGDRVGLDDLDKSAMSIAVKTFKASLTGKGYYGSFKKEPNWREKLLDTGNITDTGSAEWAKVEGFKLYLRVAEKDRLKFTDAPEKTPERFSHLLPYAVALGVEKQWAEQFAGIDVTPATNGWYAGGYPGSFSAPSLASELGGSFASTMGSNSTVSSSGGSSGGGVGGGGGGSW